VRRLADAENIVTVGSQEHAGESTLNPMALPPRVRLPAVVQTAAFMAAPISFLERSRRRYGDVFETRFLGMGRFVYVCDPQLVKQVFAADRDIGLAGEARRPFMEPVLGSQSLLTTDGEQWERQRKLIGPPFHGELIEGYRQQIHDIAVAEVERWPAGATMPLRPRMQAITLEVILRLVFGIEDATRLERLSKLFPSLGEQGAWLFWIPRNLHTEWLPPVKRLLATRDEVDAILFDEIARRRADPNIAERKDILSLLVAAGDADDQELRDELMTLLAAGHETTATSLAWAFERLARHPEVVRRVREEEGEEYLDAVVKETLRIRPVILDVIRKLKEPMQLGPWTIPVDRHPTPAIALVQRSGQIHDDRLAFKPERFIGNSGTFAGWIPFGGGRRRCVGSHLALLEMKVVIKAVLDRVDLQADDPKPERTRMHHVTLVPARGARLTVRPRSTPGSNGSWNDQSDSRSTAAPGRSSAAPPLPAETATG
jgi:cytochrome P450 family 135